MIKRLAKLAALGLVFVLVAGISAYLTVTMMVKSEDTVVVPALEGKDVVYVLQMLSELELNTKVRGTEYNPDVPKNHVIFQDPAPGDEIKKGRDVNIIISKGPRSIAMPNLAGQTLQQAGLILEENGLCRGDISRTYCPTVEADHIIAQLPPPGTMIIRGQCANFLVSLGSRPGAYKMPDLSQRRLNDTLLLLEKIHLQLGEIKSAFYKNKPRSIVIHQQPQAGSRVTTGSLVNLVINRRPGRHPAQRLDELGVANIFHYRVANGFLKRHIRIKVNSAGLTNIIFDDFVKPGKEIWLYIPRDDNTTVLLYKDGKLVDIQTGDSG